MLREVVGMSSWHAGDRAILANNLPARLPQYLKYRGLTCQLIRYVGQHSTKKMKIFNAWEIRTDNETAWVNEKWLRKPYDGHQITVWKDCVFQPKELVTS